MKKIILCLVLVLFLTTISAAAPEIKVTLLNQDPDPVAQGDVVEARFKIENQGSETYYDVEVEILPKYPFTIYSGEAIQNIGRLRAGQTGADAVILGYKLRVDEFAVEGENEIELEVRTGDLGFSYTQDEFTIDVEEYDIPEIKAYIRETDILQSNSRGTITIEIANVDEADIKFLQLTLLPSTDYELLSSSDYVYLGDVDSDDTESEDFDIYLRNVKNQATIPILLKYENTDEKEYEKEYELTLDVYDSRELSKYGLKETNYTLVVFVIIIILGVIGYLYLKKRKKAR
jgi:hypothetical protein